MAAVSSPYADRSIAASGVSQSLFAAKGMGQIEERIIFNSDATNDIWYNPFGGAASVNGLGCLKLGVGEGVSGAWTNATSVFAVATTKITAYER